MTRSPLFRFTFICICASALLESPLLAAEPAGKVDFNRDIRPILSDHCFACHGPDKGQRKADLRLDTKEGALAAITDGVWAVKPGDIEHSEVYRRITTTEADDLMPPKKSGKSLTAAQKELIKRWIEQGARWADHWAFVPPGTPALPEVKQKDWAKNPIDAFILAMLEKEGLKPSPEAEKTTLIRRTSQDVTGLPPTPEEVDAYLADDSPRAYEKLVDRLIASPRYGERMALDWLDAARFADTHGFHIDSQRDMWPWRDWLINAFNKNQRFDQFTIDQLAGDLIPNATTDQQVASGFNRNHCINFEGGAFPQEYLTAYIIDRVSTTSTVWLGLTMGCAQCHDHKFDPITQKEFYQFYAFFNRVPENGLDGRDGNAVPFVKAPAKGQRERLEEIAKQLAGLQQSIADREKASEAKAFEWAKAMAAKQDDKSIAPTDMAAHYALDERTGADVEDAVSKKAGKIKGKAQWDAGKLAGAMKFDGSTHIDVGDAMIFDRNDRVSFGAWINPSANEHLGVMSRMNDADSFHGWDLYLGDGMVYVHMVHKWEGNAIRVNTTAKAIRLNTWQHVFVTYDGSSKAEGIKIFIDGKPQPLTITHNSLSDSIAVKTPTHIGARNPGVKFKGLLDDVRFFSRQLSDVEVAAIAGSDPIRPILATPTDQWSDAQKRTLLTHYLQTQDPEYKKLTTQVADLRKQEVEAQKSMPTSMVMSDGAMRDTFILMRGEYDKPGEKVVAGLPASLPPLPKGAAMNRLGLAQWLVDPSHPLTARVMVNRIWQMHFGTGLVKTAEDFGVQGEPPSHPELLDWLATEFIRSGWDMKHMHKLMLMSAAYRQSSRVTPQLHQRDPENRLLARGPRFRLQAELIRDQALFVSGLLVEKIGGPSVKPYQPKGLWEEVAYGGGTAGFTAGTFVQDKGESLYRKSMYTFWKRTSPPPALSTFDAPEREYCVVRRSRTNTPLQALVLMNDPTYVEASRKLAERIIEKGGETTEAKIKWAVRVCLSREAKPVEIKVLTAAYEKSKQQYAADKPGALKLLAVGESTRNEKIGVAELAAWTMVANVLVNLDEMMTKN
jgi:hypothetical protein